jgi:hypothetical protein
MFNWAEKSHAKKDYSAGRRVGFRGFIWVDFPAGKAIPFLANECTRPVKTANYPNG